MESSRRDLFKDEAEHRSFLKNNQSTYYPCFSFTLKTDRTKQAFCFYCVTKGLDTRGSGATF